MSAVAWREREQSNPRVLVVDGARTSFELDGRAMFFADVVAVVADDVVRVVKNRDGITRAMTTDEWLRFSKRLLAEPAVEVIQVDVGEVERSC